MNAKKFSQVFLPKAKWALLAESQNGRLAKIASHGKKSCGSSADGSAVKYVVR